MCRKQVAAVILPLVLASLAGYSSQALSTFGVSNTKAPSAAPTTPPGKYFLYNGTATPHVNLQWLWLDERRHRLYAQCFEHRRRRNTFFLTLCVVWNARSYFNYLRITGTFRGYRVPLYKKMFTIRRSRLWQDITHTRISKYW